MKRTFKMEELCCANCAAKMETALNKIDEIDTAVINFMAQRITIVADEDKFESALDKAQTTISKIEKHCKIVR
ncbi:MAG: heavy-metal-associated domain-containing protein [Firmicutes bacterium]|jgi:copper chaperone CopZ|nr:heavy-metal-associated domain-containing protein [Bacillota bacterium]